MTEIYTPTPWQKEDLETYKDLENSADWSQMGCFKTSSTLWRIEQRLGNEPNPAVLVITTASGKGAYFRDIPKTIGSKWQIINYKADGFYLILNGMQIKIGKAKGLAEKIDFPHIVVTHYPLFSRSNINKFADCKECDGSGFADDSFLTVCPICEGEGKIAKPPTIADALIERNWDLVVLDEAHRIKGEDTKWTVNIKKLKTRYKHIMTGSGFVNRPNEIWSLLNFLEPDEFDSSWQFNREFVEYDIWSGYRTVIGLRKDKVTEFRELRKRFGPRRTKPEVFPHLKEPIFEDIYVELNPTQREMYDQIKYELMLLDQKGEPLHSPNVLSQLQRMRQICVGTPDVISDEWNEKQERRVQKIRLIEPSAKLDALMEIIDGLQWDDEDKQQIAIFSNFNDPLEMLQVRLDKIGVPWLRLRVNDNDSQRYLKWGVEFPKKNHQVFLSTIKLGGESIDLTPASYVALLDLDWAPMNNNQAIDRVWRPSGNLQYDTDRPAPIAIRFFAEDTVDQRMIDMNNQKLDWFNAIFGPKDPTDVENAEATQWAQML